MNGINLTKTVVDSVIGNKLRTQADWSADLTLSCQGSRYSNDRPIFLPNLI